MSELSKAQIPDSVKESVTQLALTITFFRETLIAQGMENYETNELTFKFAEKLFSGIV